MFSRSIYPERENFEMKIEWIIDEVDVAKVKAFYQKQSNNEFVIERQQMNLCSNKLPVSRSLIWERMVGCLITSVQRSGPNSPVSKFQNSVPFPLPYDSCKVHANLEDFVIEQLSAFKLRRYKVIAKELRTNLSFLNTGGWTQLEEHIESIRIKTSPIEEREAAAFISDSLKGFGPKQSRNLLQALGLSKYEIPLDSRITKWLNDFGFPIELSAKSLQDKSYYNFISDGFQRLSNACGIVPCVLDAAIFSSYDK